MRRVRGEGLFSRAAWWIPGRLLMEKQGRGIGGIGLGRDDRDGVDETVEREDEEEKRGGKTACQDRSRN